MKRLQFYIQEELDDALAAEAARSQTSKAELIRRYVGERLAGKSARDPLDELIGLYDEEPGDVDAIIYGA